MSKEKTHRGKPFAKGNPGGPGRPPKLKSEQPEEGGAPFDLKAEYNRLIELNTKKLERIIRAKGTRPETHIRIQQLMENRVHGMPAQAIVGGGGGPLLVAFTQILGKIDGAKHEQI